jgi:hypothetical protein
VNQFHYSLTLNNKGEIYMPDTNTAKDNEVIHTIKDNEAIRCFNGFFKRGLAGGVNQTKKGVAVFDHDGKMIHWHAETDSEKAEAVSRALTDAILDGKPIDWVALGYK